MHFYLDVQFEPRVEADDLRFANVVLSMTYRDLACVSLLMHLYLLLLQVFLFVAAVLVCLSGTMAQATATATTQVPQTMGVSDADIYNFALNLEYLEVSLNST